jgi:hypothetical protein
MAANFKCTSAFNGTTGCDVAHTATGGFVEDVPAFQTLENNGVFTPTNPTGLIWNVPFMSGIRGSVFPSVYPPSINGTAVTSAVTNSLLNTQASPGGVNPPDGGASGTYLGYSNGSNTMAFTLDSTNPSTNFLTGGGIFFNATSFGGMFNTASGGTSQSFNGSALMQGAAGSPSLPGPATPAILAPGTAGEPCEILQEKEPRIELYEYYARQGNTLGQAFWLSLRDAWNHNLYGDGLAQLWSPPAGNTATFYIP